MHRVDFLLKNPHAVAEGVLHDLAVSELVRLQKGFPADALIQKRITQELEARKYLQEQKDRSPGERAKKCVLYPVISALVLAFLGWVAKELMSIF